MQQPQQTPLVVEVVRQPEATPQISYGSVLLSAVNLVGIILVGALVVGLLVGAVIIWRKKQSEKQQSAGEPSHVRLRIQ